MKVRTGKKQGLFCGSVLQTTELQRRAYLWRCVQSQAHKNGEQNDNRAFRWHGTWRQG